MADCGYNVPKFGTKEYVDYRRNFLHEFCVPQNKIDEIDWGSFKTDSECHRFCMKLIFEV